MLWNLQQNLKRYNILEKWVSLLVTFKWYQDIADIHLLILKGVIL